MASSATWTWRDGGTKRAQLAWLYLQGIGVTRNFDKAMTMYRQSANQGDPLGEGQLGWMYVHLRKDYVAGLTWYRKVADQNDAAAENNMAYLYENGLGVPQNMKLAAHWYERSVTQYFHRAEYHLATLYDRGLGVPKDSKKKPGARTTGGRGRRCGCDSVAGEPLDRHTVNALRKKQNHPRHPRPAGNELMRNARRRCHPPTRDRHGERRARRAAVMAPVFWARSR
jgi:hypothetical protein